MTAPNLGNLAVDLPRLLETRLLVQANSGGGKSWALRRLLEQTAGAVQQIVFDPEGEFASLRERFDYIVCAPNGADAVATPQTAAALARAIWKAGTSTIIDLYELKAHERILFVRRFLESLVNAPRAIWHPTLVVLDEAHVFAPQVGSAESLGAVTDLATRGRKRGLALVAATQRLSKLHKDVAAELLNKLVGRTGLDVDVQRAADELGMNRKDATERLRNLIPGDFFAYGPALSSTVQHTRIGPVQTTHPKTGHRELIAPPPASQKVLAQLAKLEGVQREVEREAQNLDQLLAEVAALRRKVAASERAAAAPVLPPKPAAPRELAIDVRYVKALEKIAAIANGLVGLKIEGPVEQIVVEPRLQRVAAPRTNGATPPVRIDGAPAKRILDAIAWWSAAGIEQPTRHQVAFVAGYTVNGHFNNITGGLKAEGLVNYPGGGTLELTDAARGRVDVPARKPTRAELVDRVHGVLKGEPQRRLFSILVEHGKPMPREDLARAAGYTVNGHFNNLVGALNGIGIAEYPTRGSVGLSGVFEGLQP